MQRAMREQFEDERKLPTETSGIDAQVRLRLGHKQFLDTIRKHRSISILAKQTTRVHLTEVQEQPRTQRLIGADQSAHPRDQLMVRNSADIA